ncbi:MAG: hypothetical protein JWP35_1302 [Caulobacter sp.]|nr:hypothetical protein [Caulobacter sp.]
MKAAVAPAYVDGLFVAREYDGLVWLSSLVCGADGFNLASPSYGLPSSLFLFAEGLQWFAQGIRSGVWTYFEATPVPRQELMQALLRTNGPPGFSEHYAVGMGAWRSPEAMLVVDQWLEANDNANNAFLWSLAASSRALIDDLIG